MAAPFISLLLSGTILFWNFEAIGQEWSSEQKEVWQAVEADIESFKKGDLEGIMASRHDDAIIWWSNRSMPCDKKLALFNYKDWFDYDMPVNWDLEPLAIQVFGNVANVFYMYRFRGNILSGSGRRMDTWIKQDNKWLMMGSFGASCDKLPPCK